MADSIDSGSGNSSNSGDNPLKNSPWGRLSEVLSDEQLSNLFSGVGGGEGSGSPVGGGGNNGADLPYNGNPFAGDNFWNIFAGGVNPSAGGSNQGNATDPLTGGGSQGGNISTTEIPDGFALRVSIDNLIKSKLDEQPDNTQIPSSGGGGMPSFGGSGTPSFGGSGTPSFGGSETPSFGGGGMPSFGGGGMPSFGGSETPSFGGGGNPFV